MSSPWCLLLLLGCVSWSMSADLSSNNKDDRELIMIEVQHLPHDVTKRQTQQYQQRAASQQEPPQEYLDFLQQLQNGDPKSTANIQQFVVARNSPQQPTVSTQYYQQQPSSAYTLHESRLRASLAGGSPTQQQQRYQQPQQLEATSTQIDADLQRQSVLNAQQAALSFGQSYQQRGAASSHVNPPSNIRTLQPTYAPQQTYQQPQYQQAEETYQQQVQPTPQAAIQTLYQTRPQSQPSLQAYQEQASIAEQAAIAFQQAIQQQSRPGAPATRPRISAPQYVLEQQHSYVVPSVKTNSRRPTVPTPQPTEEYNLAAIQQAYQDIETANQKAVEQIQRAPQRPAPTEPTYAYEEDEGGIHIGDGDGFEFARQPTVATKQQVQQIQQVQPQRQYIQQQVQPQRQIVQPQRQIVQPQRQVILQPQPVPTQRQPVPTQQRQPLPTYQPEPEREQIPTYQPEQQSVPIYHTVPTTPTEIIRPRLQTPQAVQPTVQIPRSRAPSPQQQQFAPTPVPEVSQPVGNVGNIDLKLLRSLYAAAESLAKSQKDNVSPVSEDDLIKALLAQGRREQQAADILQNAAKQAPPAPQEKDLIETVRIPTPKNQRPITQEELQALIQAGYDVRPVDDPKVADPIKQQYLRQAEFLEQQATLKNFRAAQRGQRGAPSRRARGEESERAAPSKSES